MVEKVMVYTDASVRDAKASIGIVIQEYGPGGIKLKERDYKIILSFPEKSPNRAELYGIIYALRLLKEKYPKDIPIVIHCDSSYAINVPLKSAHPRKNRDLIYQLRNIAGGMNVEFKWIPRHKNQSADRLSK